MCTNRIHFSARSAFVILLALLLIGSFQTITSFAQAQATDPITRIDNMFTVAAENDTYSGSVLIARQGEILLEKGYGYAVREWDIPNSADTRFLIGSITKQFTAIALLILQERGTLTVDDPICNYFEDCPAAWADITIHHLLTHTSGIPDYISSPTFNENLARDVRINEIISWFRDQPLDFTPGENWSYSNSGYVLLGEIIKEVSGLSYQAFLVDSIYNPLRLENTGYARNANVIDNLAHGYLTRNQHAPYISFSIGYSAGALYSTVGDLYRWNQALVNREIISQETWEMMVARAYAFPDGSGAKYGYGLNFTSIGDHPVIGHGGTINGFVSIALYFPEQEVSVILLENIENDLDMFLELLLDMLFEE